MSEATHQAAKAVPEVIPFSDADKLPDSGIFHPATEDQLRWMHRQRKQNGLGDCFVQVAGRWLFKPRRYLEIINKTVA